MGKMFNPFLGDNEDPNKRLSETGFIHINRMFETAEQKDRKSTRLNSSH